MNTDSNNNVSTSTAAPVIQCDGEKQVVSQTGIRIRAVADTAVILLFIAVIGLPLLDMVFGIDPTPSSENRKLAPVPKAITALSNKDESFSQRISNAKQYLGDLPTEVKAYTADNFGFRNFMIRQHGEMKFGLLGVSPTHHVLLGKHDQGTANDPGDQWLFFNRYGVVEHYRATNLFTEQELEQWRRVLEQRQKWLASKGIKYLVLIAPNKHSIYPEYLPDEVNRIGKETRTDQLTTYLRKHSNIEIIDSRPLLVDARKKFPQQRLYFRTDTHWNEAGAFMAYQAAARKLAEWFPAVKPMQWKNMTPSWAIEPGGDLTAMMGIRHRFHENRFKLDPNPPRQTIVRRDQFDTSRVETKLDDPSLPTLLMFRDSFGAALMPTLAQHFKSATFIWTDQFDPREVESTKPDVVITEMLERLLMRDPPPLAGDFPGSQR